MMKVVSIDTDELNSLRNGCKNYKDLLSLVQPLLLVCDNDINKAIKQFKEQKEQISYFERLAKQHNETINNITIEKDKLHNKLCKQYVMLQELKNDKDILNKSLNWIIDNS